MCFYSIRYRIYCFGTVPEQISVQTAPQTSIRVLAAAKLVHDM